MSDSFSVLLKKPEQVGTAAIADVLAQLHKIPVQDAIHQSKSGWGFLADSISNETAHGLAEAFSKKGIETVIVGSGSVEKSRPVHLITKIDPQPDALTVHLKTNQQQKIPWPFFSVLACVAIRRTISHTIKTQEGPSAGQQVARVGIMLATGLPIPMGKKKTVEKKVDESELDFFIDLFVRETQLRIRLSAPHLDYNFLKEKKTYSADTNFRLMVDEIARLATSAIRNKGTRVLLERKPINTMGYENEAEFDRECRWLTTLAALPAI